MKGTFIIIQELEWLVVHQLLTATLEPSSDSSFSGSSTTVKQNFTLNPGTISSTGFSL
jgi:hypothetical protein